MTGAINSLHLSSLLSFGHKEKPTLANYGIGKKLSVDIVADVVNAADAATVSANVEKLGSGTADFAMANVNTGETTQVSQAPKAGAISNAKKKAYQDFEAVMLRNFVEGMLPKDSDAVYGSGTAGNTWRSMQADFISQSMAKSGGIGIAKILENADKTNALNTIKPTETQQVISSASDWPYFSLSSLSAQKTS